VLVQSMDQERADALSAFGMCRGVVPCSNIESNQEA